MITKLSIKSFKCLHDEILEFRPLTVLMGKNSSGKSSVLQTILLLARNCNPKNRERMYSLVSKYQNIDCDVLMTANEKDYVYKSSNIEHESWDILQFEEELYYLSANRIGPEDIAKLSQEYKVGTNGEFLFGTFSRYFKEKYVLNTCNIIQNDIFEKVVLDMLSDEIEKMDPLEKNISSEDIRIFLEVIKEKGYMPKEFIDFLGMGPKLNIWLSYITCLYSYIYAEKITEDSVKVLYNQENYKNINPFNIGSGTSYLAKVLILCFLAKPGDLVMIENPEIHLHPQAQSRLGEFFAFLATSGIQLVIETHCEHLLSSLRYQVYKESLKPEDIIIYYKDTPTTPFDKLLVSSTGHYTDAQNNRRSFPTGFFDTSVRQLMEIG